MDKHLARAVLATFSGSGSVQTSAAAVADDDCPSENEERVIVAAPNGNFVRVAYEDDTGSSSGPHPHYTQYQDGKRLETADPVLEHPCK